MVPVLCEEVNVVRYRVDGHRLAVVVVAGVGEVEVGDLGPRAW